MIKIENFLNDYRIADDHGIRALNAEEYKLAHDALSAYLRASGIQADGPLQVGDVVTWTSSGTRKKGHILAAVPAGRTPGDVGYSKAGGGGMSRDHVSYVIKGRRLDSKGQEAGSASLYWPHASLISRPS